MKFDYYPVGTKDYDLSSVAGTQLAKYIATDWFPGVPTSAVNGFADIICSVLNVEGYDSYWCVNPDLAVTDKQWKAATSWILGVAFTRFVIEKEGYPWWSPVSAFEAQRTGGTTKTGEWLPRLPRSQFRIEKCKSSTSRLLPDYIVCRITPNGQYEYAIVESKGTKDNIARWDTAPKKWSDQARNAELFFRDKQQTVSRNLVVATRVNPSATRSRSRRIAVRVWNSNTMEQSTDDVMFAAFLAVHYAGICWRLGFDKLADAMEEAGEEIVSEYTLAERYHTRPSLRTESSKPKDARRQLIQGAFDHLQTLDENQSLMVLRTEPPRSRAVVRGRIFEAGLTQVALNIMQSISDMTLSEIKHTASQAVAHAQTWASYYADHHNEFFGVTANGVAVFDVERSESAVRRE